jgi:hypothetical protein
MLADPMFSFPCARVYVPLLKHQLGRDIAVVTRVVRNVDCDLRY